MLNPLISIIVPIYKVEKYLEACIDSILGQTYKNLEIILVDDESPDDCGEICENYACKDRRVKVIHKINGGLSDARNAGLDIAEGEYVAFVDSDDVIHPQFIELLYRQIGHADYIFCSYANFTDNVVIEFDLLNTTAFDVVEMQSQEMIKRLLTFRYPESVIACNKLYKRDLWTAIRYPYGKIHEDEFIIHLILDISSTVKYIDLPLYYYRQREDSIMSSAKADKALLDKLEALGLRRDYLIDRGILKPVVELNGEILYRCLMQVVDQNNPTWKKMDIRSILIKNNLPKWVRWALVLKKINPKLYRLLHRYRSARNKSYYTR